MTVNIPQSPHRTCQTPCGTFVRAFLQAQSRGHVNTPVLAAELSRGASPSTRPVSVNAMYSLGVPDTLGDDVVAGEVAEAVLTAWGLAARRNPLAHREGVSLATALARTVSDDKGRAAVRQILSSSGPARMSAVRRAAAQAGPFDYGRLADDLYLLEKGSRAVARAWSSDYSK